MTIDIRQVCHPDAVRGFDTAALRLHFLVQRLFRPGEVALTYSHSSASSSGARCRKPS